MKTIRNFLTLVGLFVGVLALSAVGARAQQLFSSPIAGTFTLPFEAQWGLMTLPAGEYNLYYGYLSSGGSQVVEVEGIAKGSPRGFIQVASHNPTATTKTMLVCIREGKKGIVRELDMAEIGESVFFAPPQGAKFVASQRNHNVYAQLGEASMLIQRIPVTLNGK